MLKGFVKKTAFFWGNMRIIDDKTYNFLFHPLFKEHSPVDAVLSVATVVGLTAISFGAFGILFATMQWKDRNITVSPNTPQTETTTQLFSTHQTKPSQAEKPLPIIEKRTPSSPKVALIKKEQANQLEKFEKWALANQWGKIKEAHYDWWMFPVNRDSSAYGATYNVNNQDIEALKKDPAFMNAYKRGVELVVKAWGWDLQKEEAVANPSKYQYWDGYGVRLAKMSDSLQLFGQRDLHKKLKDFFVTHCLPRQPKIVISNLSWLQKTFHLPTSAY